MDKTLTAAQQEDFLGLLDTVMGVLRDDAPLPPLDSMFRLGTIDIRDPQTGYVRYSFLSSGFPGGQIFFTTVADPLNYSEDRTKVPVVPESFDLMFSNSVIGIDRKTLEQRLKLADYWVDDDGNRHEGNSQMPIPPAIRLHNYRYRAIEQSQSRFAVDVELFYIDPPKDDPSQPQILDGVKISRSYPYLTPDMRKQRREEKEQRVRDMYGNSGATP